MAYGSPRESSGGKQREVKPALRVLTSLCFPFCSSTRGRRYFAPYRCAYTPSGGIPAARILPERRALRSCELERGCSRDAGIRGNLVGEGLQVVVVSDGILRGTIRGHDRLLVVGPMNNKGRVRVLLHTATRRRAILNWIWLGNDNVTLRTSPPFLEALLVVAEQVADDRGGAGAGVVGDGDNWRI